MIKNETMVIAPTEDPTHFVAKNIAGHTIDIYEDLDGNLTAPVRDGPNAGHTSKWERE